MKTAIILIASFVLCLGLAAGCAKNQPSIWESIKNPEIVTRLKSFVAEKEAQANAVTNKTPKEFKKFFAAANKGDWLSVSNMFFELGSRNGHFDTESSKEPDYSLRGIPWAAVSEVWGTFAAFKEGDEQYSTIYANEIINSIPPGSLYFGGTDAGRFLITGMQKSQVNGDPFFTLTQNALADMTYLDYLRSIYGEKIYIPSAEDSQKAFMDYEQDVARRQRSNQLKPGEDVKVGQNGSIQISGQVAVMEINGLLVKDVFEKETNREFYVEESFALDWMYPYLEPHGLIMKINRQPLAELSDEIVRRDRDYWTKYLTPIIGDWLKPDTTVAEIAAFAEKVHIKKDLSGFTSDSQFVGNEYSCKIFSKERCSIAGIYAWRAQNTSGDVEKKRMNDAADFAFRQSFALCPYSPETVVRYVNLLMSEKRFSDALLVAETAAKMPAMKGRDGNQIRDLVAQLKRNAQ